MSLINISLANAIIEKYNIRTIRDIVSNLNAGMCHILQEPKIFQTYPPEVSALLFEGDELARVDATYQRFRNEIIPSIGVGEHLKNLTKDVPERKPCFCRQMTDVAAIIAAQLLQKKVYAVRNIYVNYLYLPQQWHCINAVVEEDRIRYFDTSAYAQIVDPKDRRIRRPSKLAGFDAADIAPAFIESDKWLQKQPFQRTLTLFDGHIRDSFAPSPFPNMPEDEFLSVVEPVAVSGEIARCEVVS